MNKLVLLASVLFMFNVNVFANSEAIEYYTNEIKFDSDNAIAYYNRGLAYYGAGKYKKAIQDYNRALELDNTDYRVYSNRGNAYYALDDIENACRDGYIAKELGSFKFWEWLVKEGVCIEE